jgi:hypothetical protein
MRDMPTPDLTRVLEAAIRQHQPPLVRGRRIRLRYAHQGGRNPPVIVVHGAQAERTPEDYRRYLANCYREAFRLAGTPVRVDFRSEENPFAWPARQADPATATNARPRQGGAAPLTQGFAGMTRALNRPCASRASTSVPGGASVASRTTAPLPAIVTIA